MDKTTKFDPASITNLNQLNTAVGLLKKQGKNSPEQIQAFQNHYYDAWGLNKKPDQDSGFVAGISKPFTKIAVTAYDAGKSLYASGQEILGNKKGADETWDSIQNDEKNGVNMGVLGKVAPMIGDTTKKTRLGQVGSALLESVGVGAETISYGLGGELKGLGVVGDVLRLKKIIPLLSSGDWITSAVKFGVLQAGATASQDIGKGKDETGAKLDGDKLIHDSMWGGLSSVLGFGLGTVAGHTLGVLGTKALDTQIGRTLGTFTVELADTIKNSGLLDSFGEMTRTGKASSDLISSHYKVMQDTFNSLKSSFMDMYKKSNTSGVTDEEMIKSMNSSFSSWKNSKYAEKSEAWKQIDNPNVRTSTLDNVQKSLQEVNSQKVGQKTMKVGGKDVPVPTKSGTIDFKATGNDVYDNYMYKISDLISKTQKGESVGFDEIMQTVRDAPGSTGDNFLDKKMQTVRHSFFDDMNAHFEQMGEKGKELKGVMDNVKTFTSDFDKELNSKYGKLLNDVQSKDFEKVVNNIISKNEPQTKVEARSFFDMYGAKNPETITQLQNKIKDGLYDHFYKPDVADDITGAFTKKWDVDGLSKKASDLYKNGLISDANMAEISKFVKLGKDDFGNFINGLEKINGTAPEEVVSKAREVGKAQQKVQDIKGIGELANKGDYAGVSKKLGEITDPVQMKNIVSSFTPEQKTMVSMSTLRSKMGEMLDNVVGKDGKVTKPAELADKLKEIISNPATKEMMPPEMRDGIEELQKNLVRMGNGTGKMTKTIASKTAEGIMGLVLTATGHPMWGLRELGGSVMGITKAIAKDRAIPDELKQSLKEILEEAKTKGTFEPNKWAIVSRWLQENIPKEMVGEITKKGSGN